MFYLLSFRFHLCIILYSFIFSVSILVRQIRFFYNFDEIFVTVAIIVPRPTRDMQQDAEKAGLHRRAPRYAGRDSYGENKERIFMTT